MKSLYITPPHKGTSFHDAMRMAMIEAHAQSIRHPAVLSWHDRIHHGFSPGFEGADEALWWEKYGEGHGGKLMVNVGDEYEFIVTDVAGFDTPHAIPIRNLSDEEGNEYLCFTPMLDDTGRPRPDACIPLDEWMAKQN